MRLPAIQGVIDRRMLVNYRLDPALAARVLPAPFRPKLAGGFAIAGICLIRLRGIRPVGWPMLWPIRGGLRSENAAHRFAVEWEQDGQVREGVYIPRRDSDSRLNTLLGGRLVPGVHHAARFDVEESADRLSIAVASNDGNVRMKVVARLADAGPAGSVFASNGEASEFFERGSLGYSATNDPTRYDGLELRCKRWSVQPLAVESVESSYFDDTRNFPARSAVFDCALLMRGVEHEWHSREDLCRGVV